MDRTQYEDGVTEIRRLIHEGEVYQANLCRVLKAPLPTTVTVENPGGQQDPYALAAVLSKSNPAPYAGVLDVPERWIVSASPELFLRRSGDLLETGPIKGTAPTAQGLLPKDVAENIMITDLVRNDLQKVCRPGTVGVSSLLETQEHPGLVHLVTTVQGQLNPGAGWGEIFAALCPAGSVSGAPKITALKAIESLETVPRGPYCGAIGWVDGTTKQAELAVGIRSFWADRDEAGNAPQLSFGTGAGVTWGSNPENEWKETELKASRLVSLASAKTP